MRDWAAQRAKSGASCQRDDEFSYLSFRLSDEFIEQWRTQKPAWGYPMGGDNTLGELSWITKYSRVKKDGTKERFYEGLRRVIEGMYSIQKDHALRNRLPWKEEIAHRSAEEAYTRAFAGKWSPPGRGFWVLGTEFVNGRNDSSPLQNCGFLSTKFIDTDYSEPFTTLMNMSMLGIGVGFDTLGAGKITLHNPTVNPDPKPFVIEDSREGWCKSVGRLLDSYFLSNRRCPDFGYGDIRKAGSPINGFGGTSAGPTPLRKLHTKLRGLLRNRDGETLTSTDIVDIMNLIGKCVVAANVRSSAEIALGSSEDEAFLDLKDWRINPKRMGDDGWGFISNNSVVAKLGGDYGHLAERMALNGEPGLVWLDVIRGYGRLVDGPDNKDRRASGINPCGEQPLEHHELCTLVETFPSNCDDLDDYLRTLKFAYLYGKTITLLMTRWPKTNEVMIRNRRIGTSMTGIVQFAEEHGWNELTKWQNAGYDEIRKWDVAYSEWLGVRESIRVTTVKPSGTVSLLFGVTPGCHWPRERGYYVRTVRESIHSPMVKVMQDAGYPVEPSVSSPDTMMVISCPVLGPDIRSEAEVSCWEKAALAAHCQRYWSDNSVSVTITFDAKRENQEIPAILRAYEGQLKAISFMPMTEGTYKQAPYQKVPFEVWNALVQKVKPIDWDFLYGENIAPTGELYCSNEACEIK
jgi:ribonucleoside-triphosphate reductase (thioredoxin)